MGDRATLAKARRELEELYLGVPDDSVNLTFQDFAQLSQNVSAAAAGKNKPSPPPPSTTTTNKMNPISESKHHHHHFPPPTTHNLTKIPSLDFSRGLEAASTAPPYHHHRVTTAESPILYGHQVEDQVVMKHGLHHHHVMENNSMAYDDVSMMSGRSMTSMYQDKTTTTRRRPGIPHSNICTVCSVCGRVYCRQCMDIGMGEMTEGRKCLDCLGRKFSQRYIHRAGNVGCWSSCLNGYPSGVKIQELKWAEKGPRRSAENRSVMMIIAEPGADGRYGYLRIDLLVIKSQQQQQATAFGRVQGPTIAIGVAMD
ncbi:hypothetical protein L6452_37880 [Arctium lappa]|uniref:Uncharacterized protein n=1 Tax=Arctium lappa TaxID=4217 RepID=A0ACB8Y4W4_ARCLA|nr:hypothetical protein L6452_37880 [Arctium lappa]